MFSKFHFDLTFWWWRFLLLNTTDVLRRHSTTTLGKLCRFAAWTVDIFIIGLSLWQEHGFLRGYGLPSPQEVTQYWLALHFLYADSSELLSGCLPPPSPRLPLPPSTPPLSLVMWLYVAHSAAVHDQLVKVCFGQHAVSGDSCCWAF